MTCKTQDEDPIYLRNLLLRLYRAVNRKVSVVVVSETVRKMAEELDGIVLEVRRINKKYKDAVKGMKELERKEEEEMERLSSEGNLSGEDDENADIEDGSFVTPPSKTTGSSKKAGSSRRQKKRRRCLEYEEAKV